MSIPRGVVGIISPWNYPLFLTIAPMVAAIAAGNRVMIKLSENVPKTSALIQKLFTQAFLETKIAVVLGDSEIAAEFSQLPFDHLLFTGATSIGKKVMQAASVNLTPITLELGGKSPVILTDKINYSDIDKIWLGKIINAGQTCIAPDYIWLPKDDGLERNLLEYSKLAVSKRFANLDQSEYCSIINKNQYDRILLLIDDAVTKGATWQPLIDFSGRWYSSDNNIYKIAPGLLLNAQHNMAIMQEEIFGPVLPVMKYDAIQELLTIMQALPRPLAIYLFTNNKTIQYDFIYKTLSGALSFNHTIVHAAQESLPFGGVNTSGMGHYRGRYGFDTFSLLKPIYKQSRLEIFSKFYPPKKMWQKFLLRFMLK
jgi:coniferyl-aldehyde dehydrogenase